MHIKYKSYLQTAKHNETQLKFYRIALKVSNNLIIETQNFLRVILKFTMYNLNKLYSRVYDSRKTFCLKYVTEISVNFHLNTNSNFLRNYVIKSRIEFYFSSFNSIKESKK